MATDVRLLLKEMVERGGSDLYITAESPPVIRIEGVNQAVAGEPLTPTEVEALANSLMTERQRAAFEEEMEMNLGISSSKLGRFRDSSPSLPRRPHAGVRSSASWPALPPRWG